MFVTHPIYKSPMSDFLANAGETHWMAARLQLQQIWFLVDVCHLKISKRGKEGPPSHRTILLTSMDDVEGVEGTMPSGDDGGMVRARIESIFIVTPSYTNASKGWKMDQLASVWTAKEPKKMSFARIYETCDGQVYTDAAFATPCEDLVCKELQVRFVQTAGSAVNL